MANYIKENRQKTKKRLINFATDVDKNFEMLKWREAYIEKQNYDKYQNAKSIADFPKFDCKTYPNDHGFYKQMFGFMQLVIKEKGDF